MAPQDDSRFSLLRKTVAFASSNARCGGISSFASLPNSPRLGNDTGPPPSLFAQLHKASRRSGNDDLSSLSVSYFQQESSIHRRKSTESKKRPRSSLSCLSNFSSVVEISDSTSLASTSRSLFGSLIPSTAGNTQTTNTRRRTSNSSASGNAGALSSRTSLFGSVMQTVENRTGSFADDRSSNYPSKYHHTPPSKTMNVTITARPEWSAFTPAESSRAPFGSPGGFQMLDFVKTFASPFHKSNGSLSLSGSNLCTESNSESLEWKNTSFTEGVTDWSLPKSLKFEFCPACIVNSVLKKSPEITGLGMAKFLQRCGASNGTTTNMAEEGLAEWESGLLYWQHPSVRLSPFAVHPIGENKIEAAGRNPEATKGKNEDPFQKPTARQRKASLCRAQTNLVADMGNALIGGRTNQSASQQQQQNFFTQQRRLEWTQALASLYWKWISQLQQHQFGNNTTDTLEKAYFYACAEDHVVLFLGVEERGAVVPKICISSSSEVFRDTLRSLSVEELCLMESWEGHPKGGLFVENMIQQGKAQANAMAEGKMTINDASLKDSSNGEAGRTLLPRSMMKENQTSTLEQLFPCLDSNSPFVMAELAALRRAQVFGETVGAGVTVCMQKKHEIGGKLSLGSIPPLTVTGFDECAAFFEAYLNMGSSCCSPSTPETTKGRPCSIGGSIQKSLTHIADWQVPQDVPVLICRKVGPFCNASLKSLTARGNSSQPHRSKQREPGSSECDNYDYAILDVQGGPILPCAITQLFGGLVQTMIADKERNATLVPSETIRGEEPVIGSHNLILRPLPRAANAHPEEQQQNSKDRIIGSSRANAFNQFQCRDGIESGQVLRMVVWDILHPKAMAYKVESFLPSTPLFQ